MQYNNVTQYNMMICDAIVHHLYVLGGKLRPDVARV